MTQTQPIGTVQSRDEFRLLHLLQRLTFLINESADFNDALTRVLREICRSTGWDYGEVWIPDHEAGVVRCSPAWYGRMRGIRRFRQISEETAFKPGQGLPGRVWETRQPEWQPNVSLLPVSRFPRTGAAREAGIRAGFGVPVFEGDEIFAILSFFMTGEQPRDDRLLSLVSAAARQLGSFMRRIQAEEALRQSEQRFRIAIDKAEIAVFHQDRDLRYTWFHQPRPRLPDSHLIGRTNEEVFLPGEAAAITALQQQVIDSAEGLRTEIALTIGDELRHFDLSLEPLFGPQGRVAGLTGAAVDITERKREEEARARLEARMQEAQRLESLGVLAGGIAHDFNNLLMGIVGNASVALLELPREAPARDTIKDIEAAGRRAADLIRQLLAYSGKGQFIIEPIDLSRLVEEMTHLLSTAIARTAVLRLDLADPIPLVRADATQIRQVIMNLITNASDAVGEQSGLITIRTGAMHADESYLREIFVGSDAPPGDYAFVEVSDTGAGMDEETRAHIFDPFFTTKSSGRGLGLAAVLGIVRSHRGAIKVYSQPGKGTTIKFLLPATPTEVAANGGPVHGPAVPLAGNGRTILIVDDEETVRIVAARMLERAGFKVLHAADGRQAVEIFRRNQDEIALVLLDLTMPHVGGEEAFRQLRTLDPEVRVLLASGYNEHDATASFAGKGLAGFIQKPFGVDQLADSIARLLPPEESES